MPQTPEERRARMREYANRRYAEDAAYRERAKENAKAYRERMRAENPEYYRKLDAERVARWRKAHPDDYRHYRSLVTAKYRKRNREFIRAYKEGKPCADCGGHFPHYAMDFDHTDGEKAGNVATMSGRATSIAKLEAEIAKCVLVCANCHRGRTYARLSREEQEEIA